MVFILETVFIVKIQMNMRRAIQLNEQQLKKIIAESVKNILQEIGDTRGGQYMLGKLWRKKYDEKFDESPDAAWKNR